RDEAVGAGYAIEGEFYIAVDDDAGYLPFYRCALGAFGHLYTQSPDCEGAGRLEQRMGFVAGEGACGSTPLYRLFHPISGDHFYTTSAPERDAALRIGYRSEGTAGHVWTVP